MATKVYQIKGEFFHLDCLSKAEQETIEITGIEVDPKKLDQEDLCASCGENALLNGEDEGEPSEFEKDEDD